MQNGKGEKDYETNKENRCAVSDDLYVSVNDTGGRCKGSGEIRPVSDTGADHTGKYF